jgi:hypothetical protein
MLAVLFAIATIAAVRGLWSPCGLSMLSSLNPVSEQTRGHRFWLTALWYLLGAAVGGALLGTGCAACASVVQHLNVPSAATWSAVLVAAAIAALSDARVGGWSLPMHPRQVDERWLTKYRRWIYASGYGVQIGTGVATYVMTAGVYLTAVVAVASGRPGAAFAAGVVFGVVRGLGIGIAALARDPDRLRLVLRRVDACAGGSALAACLACLAVAAVAAWRIGGAPSGFAVIAGLALPIGFAAGRNARMLPERP